MPYMQMAFRSIQYSWRFLTIAVLLLMWMFCLIAKEMIEKKKSGFRQLWIACCAICLFQAVEFSSDVLNDMDPHRVYSGANLEMDDIGGGEYLPLGTNTEELINRPAAEEGIVIEEWGREYLTNEMYVRNNTEESKKIEIPLLYYRYYEAEGESGERLAIERAKNGRIAVEIPPKWDNEIKIYFKEPVLWRMAELFSMMTVAGSMVFYFRTRNKEERK